MAELPKNCLFNKGKIGCGGTSLAIESDMPYVIAVPFGIIQVIVKVSHSEYYRIVWSENRHRRVYLDYRQDDVSASYLKFRTY